jgi:6-phosphogluconolactonase
VQVLAGADDIGRAAAAHVGQLAAEAVPQRGRFMVAFSGGSLLTMLCPGLLTEPLRSAIHWPAWHVFCADERCVPLSDDRSNFGALRTQLLDRVAVPVSQMHPVNTSLAPVAAARDYQARLADVFQPTEGEAPRFDLILLGLGEDGHTASLFPGHPALTETRRWVTAILDSPKSPAERVSLTLPVLNNARHVIFIAAGAGKAAALVRALSVGDSSDDVPAGRVRPSRGELTWYVDGAAAQLSGGEPYVVGR